MQSGPLTDAVMAGVGMLGAVAVPSRARLLLLCSFARLARQPRWLVLAGAAVAVVVARICLIFLMPQPQPIIPDEFSHLFVAQTLVSGRLANPMHPMWRHFETLFVSQRPTYSSPYPPLQGVFLALGMVLTGNAWYGVLLSIGGMCAAIVWMLQAYVTRFWAVYGGVLAAAGYGIASYWTNTYWGGAGAALGGALVLGALPRIAAKNRLCDAAALAIGFLFLANSRPYEGFLFCIPVLGWLLRHFTRQVRKGAPGLANQMFGLGGFLFVAVLVTCWYNWRVTGSPFRLPYSSYIRQYAAAPIFVWQRPPGIPEYTDRVLREAHLSFRSDYTAFSTFSYFLWTSVDRLGKIARFYFGPFWAVALALLPDVLRKRRHAPASAPDLRLLFAAVTLCIGGILLTVSSHLHYAAPCACVFILLLIEAFRRVRLFSRVLGTCLLISAPSAWLAAQALTTSGPHMRHSLDARPGILAQLGEKKGDQLVFVHYSHSHALGEEWIYNGSDIDRSRVIWARDLGPQMNDELIKYYPGRKTWVLEPDGINVRLSRCVPPCTGSD